MAAQEPRGTQNTGPASSLLQKYAVVVTSFIVAFKPAISLLGYDQEVDKDVLSWGAAQFDALEQWQQQALVSVMVVFLLFFIYRFFRWACATINYKFCLSKEAQAEQDYEEFLEEQKFDKSYVAIGMGDAEFLSELDKCNFRGKEILGGKKSGPRSFTAVRNKQKKIILDNARSVLELNLKTLFTASKLKDVGFNAAQLKEGNFTLAELKAVNFTASELKAVNFTLAELKAVNFTASELKAANFTLAELLRLAYSTADEEKLKWWWRWD